MRTITQREAYSQIELAVSGKHMVSVFNQRNAWLWVRTDKNRYQVGINEIRLECQSSVLGGVSVAVSGTRYIEWEWAALTQSAEHEEKWEMNVNRRSLIIRTS